MFINRAHKELETHLLKAAFQLAAKEGWHQFKLIDAAKEANLSPDIMRNYFPLKTSLLLTLNRLADDGALNNPEKNAPLRDKIFESFMQRFDIFQDYREGLGSVLHALPKDPALAAILSAATMNSMRWIADNVALDRKGVIGFARLNSLFLIWLNTLHTWQKDTTPDLAETMNTLNISLDRAEKFGFLKEDPLPFHTSHETKIEAPLDITPQDSERESKTSETKTSLPDFKEEEKS